MPWKVFMYVQLFHIWKLFVCIRGHDDFTVDIAKLAAYTQGTELIVVEQSLHTQRSYKLEDFFWTGSGDGSSDEDTATVLEPTTVYSTKTIMSTVYMTPTAFVNQTSKACTDNCATVMTEDIDPTPTMPTDYDGDGDDDDDGNLDADRQFWLLTVLKSDGKDPDITELKRSLAKLYKKAFLRQQAKHLGINSRTKRENKLDKPINVYIHKIDKLPTNGDRKIEVIYHVSVSGQPVDAVTAAEDMRLVTDDEVKEALGYPFLVKAEPYIKPTTPQGLTTQKSTWVYVGLSSVVVLLILLAIILLAVCVTKHHEPMTVENMQRAFEEQPGQLNLTAKEYTSGRRNQNPSPTYIKFRSQASDQALLTNLNGDRPQSGRSSASSSNASVDISPLIGLGKQRTDTKKLSKPRAATNKTTPLTVPRSSTVSLIDSESSSTISNTSDTIFVKNNDPGVVSPKSYLSMPSVRSFPRGNNPEPLHKVLEPVSMLHLDMVDDIDYDDQPRVADSRVLARSGSVGTAEDPGVIGPVVWNMHCHRLQHGLSVDEGIDDMKMTNNVSKMRKRFHELLDDTFSLFGSRRESPVRTSPHTIEVKSHSGVERELYTPPLQVRPKTSEIKRPSVTNSTQRKGAWTSATPSPLVRPLSAPYVRPNTAPRVDVQQVLAEGILSQNDPAIPLIAAIKKEIGKCSLPGSTTNLQD